MTRIYMFLKQLCARCSLHSSSKRQWHADNSPPPTTNFNYPPSFNRLVLTACCSTSAWSDYANSWSDDVASSQDTDSDGDGDGVNDSSDAFPLDANEIINTDLDGIGNNTAHASPLDHTETVDADGNVINFTNSTMFVFNNCIVDSATFSLPPSRTPTLKSKPDAKPRESTKPLKCSWMTSMMFLSPRWSSKWGFSMARKEKTRRCGPSTNLFFWSCQLSKTQYPYIRQPSFSDKLSMPRQVAADTKPLPCYRHFNIQAQADDHWLSISWPRSSVCTWMRCHRGKSSGISSGYSSPETLFCG